MERFGALPEHFFGPQFHPENIPVGTNVPTYAFASLSMLSVTISSTAVNEDARDVRSSAAGGAVPVHERPGDAECLPIAHATHEIGPICRKG